LTGSLVTANVANSGSGAKQLHASGGGVSTALGMITDSVITSNDVNTGSDIGLVYLSGEGIDDTGPLTVTDSIIALNAVKTNPNSGRASSDNPSYAVGGGIGVESTEPPFAATLTLNHSVVAGNFTLGTPPDISARDGGQVDTASANNLIGDGGSGRLVNGVNGNVVLGP
jgi:hypothetical protein